MHSSKAFWGILKKAKKRGFKVEIGNHRKMNIKIIPPDSSLKLYITHPSEKAYHSVRRFLDKTEKSMLENQ